MGKIRILLKIGLMIFVFISSVLYVYAEGANATPIGPDYITVYNTSRRLPGHNESLWAHAGNITELDIYVTQITRSWAGYVGNVTGIIKLDDNRNFTMYEWNVEHPTGEIYAAWNRSDISWTQIKCQNFTNPITDVAHSGWAYNVTTIETAFGINGTHLDGLDETFNETYTNRTGFYVGGIHIDYVDNCPMAHPFTNETWWNGTNGTSGSFGDHGAPWEEVLLTDNKTIIFTSILQDDGDGYKKISTANDDTWDFQMMVLEDGHPGQEGHATQYWFFLEIE